MLSLPDNRPYVIGEIGMNHNGSVESAQTLINKLADAGADCAKLQLYRTDHLVSGVYMENVVEVFRRHELSREDYLRCQETAIDAGLDLAASVFDRSRLDWYVEETEAPFIKIASGDLTFKRLISEAGKHDLPVIMSTGAGTIDEIKRARDWLDTGEGEVYLLHCVPQYPASENRLNLRRIETIAGETDCLVGFSDHSESSAAPVIASAMGAVIWERHVTLDSDQEGPEHEFSLEVDALNQVIDSMKKAWEHPLDDLSENHRRLLGDGDLKLDSEDHEFRENARRSLMADRALSAGSTLSEDMIRELRPGTGLPADRIDECLGLPIQRPTDPLHMISY